MTSYHICVGNGQDSDHTVLHSVVPDRSVAIAMATRLLADNEYVHIDQYDGDRLVECVWERQSQFEAATITLIGGPHAGKIVS